MAYPVGSGTSQGFLWTTSPTELPSVAPFKIGTHTPVQAAAKTLALIGSDERLASSDHFIMTDELAKLTISGTAKWSIGHATVIDVQGNAVAPTIFGQYTKVNTGSLILTGSSTIYGTYCDVQIGGPFTNSFGGYFASSIGGTGGDGSGNVVGVYGIGSIHNGDADFVAGGDFLLNSSDSTGFACIMAIGAAIRARAQLRPFVTATDLSGLSITNWTLGTDAEATNSYGIYIDTSIDIGATSKWAIYSLSTSPSRLSGPLQISEMTAPSAPPANTAVLYVDDNGAGKTRLMVRFPTGAAAQLSIEP